MPGKILIVAIALTSSLVYGAVIAIAAASSGSLLGIIGAGALAAFALAAVVLLAVAVARIERLKNRLGGTHE